MEYRIPLNLLSHTIVAVDISGLGLPTEIYPPEGKEQLVPTRRFQSWKHAERYLVELGATAESLQTVSEALRKASVALLFI